MTPPPRAGAQDPAIAALEGVQKRPSPASSRPVAERESAPVVEQSPRLEIPARRETAQGRTQ